LIFFIVFSLFGLSIIFVGLAILWHFWRYEEEDKEFEDLVYHVG